MYHKNKAKNDTFLVNNLDKSSTSKSSSSNTSNISNTSDTNYSNSPSNSSSNSPPVTPPIVSNTNSTNSLHHFQHFFSLQKKTNTTNTTTTNTTTTNTNTKHKYKPTLKDIPELIYNPPYHKLILDNNNNNDTINNTSIKLENYIHTYFNITKKYLKSNVHPDTIKAIIAPFSPIKESGLCCASSYYQLYNRTMPIKKVILLCTKTTDTTHTTDTDNFISTSFTHIKSYNHVNTNSNTNNNTTNTTNTTNKYLKIDSIIIDKLKHYLDINNEYFEHDMSFLSQLPFIETIAPRASLIPILISNNIYLNNTNLDKINSILHILKNVMKQEDTIVICVSNLTTQSDNPLNTNAISNIITNCNIKNQDNIILQFIYNTINGVKTRSSKIDDILFIQNTPSPSTMCFYIFSKLLNNYIDISKQSCSSLSSMSSDDSGISVNCNNTQNILYSRITSYYTSNYKSIVNNDITHDTEHFTPQHLLNTNTTNTTNTSNTNTTNTNTTTSYIGLIFTSQPYLDNSNIRILENAFTEYEKIALISFIKEQFYLNLNLNTNANTNTNIHTTTQNYMNHIHKYNCNVTNINNMPINTPMFKTHLGLFITIVDKKNKLRGCIGTSETNNDEYTIENNIKRFVLELSTKETKCRDLVFQPITLDELHNTIDKLSFNITILYHMKSLHIDKYYSNQFKFGNDGLLFQSLVNVDNKHTTKCKYSLTSISTYFNTNTTENTDNINKIKLISELFKHINDTKQNEFKLFYNEGMVINDTII